MNQFFNYLEKSILVVILISTVVAFATVILGLFEAGTVELADILLLFILLEIFGMIKEYYFQNRIAFSYPIFIAITALARLIILQRKDFDPVLLLYESGAILILAAAIVILRLRYLDVLVKNRKVGGGQ
ncbi:MAG: phosphate-starvation-inducible PsiE family protein [Pseudomonadota bacterium]|jgi:protein PsiE|nr:phosphate-starvation-inducible PsiE family protein [Pseudomonadota bacterium]|tara:strand:+ start:717 stop:1103 length:387 start_codon:yes stop_codon:yes gene_type:complete